VAERAGRARTGEREIGEYEWAWDARSGDIVCSMYVWTVRYEQYLMCTLLYSAKDVEASQSEIWLGRALYLAISPYIIAIFRDSNSNNIQYKLQYAGSLFPLTRCDPAGGLTGSTASTLLYVVPLSSAPLSAKFYGDGRYRIQYLRMWSIAQPRFSPSRL
jgi:hypothetical protein